MNLEGLGLSSNELSGCIPGELREIQRNDLWALALPFCN